MHSESTFITIDCYISDGKFYRGFANKTEKGFICKNWMSSNKYNPTTKPDKVTIHHVVIKLSFTVYGVININVLVISGSVVFIEI